MKFKTLGFSILGFGLCWCGWAASPVQSHLLPVEQNTIKIFQKTAPKVVYVHRMTQVANHANQSMHVVPAGTGSGIIWDKQGHVVTNYHVIRKADALAITVGHETVPVKVIGAEPRKDLAVLKIESSRVLKQLQSMEPLDMRKQPARV